MEAKQVKTFISGNLILENWGMSAVITDEQSREILHINPYGASTHGKLSTKHQVISEALISAVNNTYQSGIDPAKLPTMISELMSVQESLTLIGVRAESQRNSLGSIAKEIKLIAVELEKIRESIKIV